MALRDNQINAKNLISPLGVIGSTAFFWIAIAALFSNILGLSTSLFIMVVYDRVLPNEATSSLYALAAGVILAITFDILLKRARTRIVERSTVNSDQTINQNIFDEFIESGGTKEQKPIGELASIMRDVEMYRDFMSSATILTLIDIPFAILFVGVIYLIGGPLCLVPLICIPLIVILILSVQPLLAKNSVTVSNSSQTRQGLLVEILSGLSELRVNGAFSIMRRKFLTKSDEYTKASQKAKSYAQVNENIINVIQQGSQVAVIVYGFHLFVSQDITMGAIIATVILSGRAIAPLAKVGQTLGRLNTALHARKNLIDFLNSPRLPSDEKEAINSVSGAAIDIVNTTLNLSDFGRPIFNELSIKVNKGEKVAIVGRSGSGKTTLVKMMLGLLKPETGTVLINGKDIRQYSRTHLFQTVGAVFQDPWLFSGTLRENVGLGHDLCDDQIIKDCLINMGGIFGQSEERVDLDINISDQGKNLSGGQKQSVTLARALAFDPGILLLDEPTSGMDVKTEGLVIKGLKQTCKDKTLVVVTHKIALVSLCERVVVVEQGKIIWDDTIEKYIQLINQANAKNDN